MWAHTWLSVDDDKDGDDVFNHVGNDVVGYYSNCDDVVDVFIQSSNDK